MRHIRPLVVTAVAALVLAAPHAARADETFTMYGAGYGHGLGMGQWGSYGMALDGWTAPQILTHFYTGTSVAQAPNPPGSIRVGLLHGLAAISIKAVGGPVTFRVGSPTSTVIGTLQAPNTYTIEAKEGRYWIKRPSGTYVGGHGWGGVGTNLLAQYFAGGGMAYLPGTAHNYKWGSFELNLYSPCTGCALDLRLVNVIGTQAYLYGLAEVPSSWPIEALEAQAIAGRTYAFYKVATVGQNRPTCNCAVYDDTFDQVFAGADKVLALDGDRWVSAVDATSGQAVLSGGAVIGAFYASSSGGFTESKQYVWGGDPIGYLTGVCDPGDFALANPNRVWTVAKTGATIGNQLQAYTGVDIGNATSFTNGVRGVSGRLVSVTVNGTTRSLTVSGTTLRRALFLKDTRVWINTNKNVTGGIREKYDAIGCAPGLQTSASISVEGGRYQVFEIGRMYANYTTGESYWIHGPVYVKYLAMGAHASVLGLPQTNVMHNDATAADWAIFAGGRIYSSAATGAHEVHGLVLAEYIDQNTMWGALGLPITDVVVSGTQRTTTFQHGTISCNATSGTCTTTTNAPAFG